MTWVVVTGGTRRRARATGDRGEGPSIWRRRAGGGDRVRLSAVGAGKNAVDDDVGEVGVDAQYHAPSGVLAADVDVLAGDPLSRLIDLRTPSSRTCA